MLRATRLVTASKRGFATVVDASPGFKVAAVDNGQPTSSVTVLLKAGSRYESKPGVAHALSNFAFKVRSYALLVVPRAVVQSILNNKCNVHCGSARGSSRWWALWRS
jgi:hypothetical protein